MRYNIDNFSVAARGGFNWVLFNLIIATALILGSVQLAAAADKTSGWADKFRACVAKKKVECTKHYPPASFGCEKMCFQYCKDKSSSPPVGYKCYSSGDGYEVLIEGVCVEKICSCTQNCVKDKQVQTGASESSSFDGDPLIFE